jgi:hypothetical protein
MPKYDLDTIIGSAPHLKGIFDGCNLLKRSDLKNDRIGYAGIGRGKMDPTNEFINFVAEGFQAVQRGFANELQYLINFINDRYAPDEFNRVDFRNVQKIAGTCVTGCRILDPGAVIPVRRFGHFLPRLVACAQKLSS